jgi:hypothetical protein
MKETRLDATRRILGRTFAASLLSDSMDALEIRFCANNDFLFSSAVISQARQLVRSWQPIRTTVFDDSFLDPRTDFFLCVLKMLAESL